MLVKSRRLRRCLSFVLAFILTGSLASAAPAQKQASRDRGSQSDQSKLDDSFTRPRRTESRADQFRYTSPEGPMIRVGLMTNVSSVALGSPSGFVLRGQPANRDNKKVPAATIRVELRQLRDAKVSKSEPGQFQVRVSAKPDARSADRVAYWLKQQFFEPVSVVFVEKQNEYVVSIGRFANRTQAERLAERLRDLGYEDARVVSEQKLAEDWNENSVTDTNARAAKSKVQPERAAAWADQRRLQLVAVASDKVAAASEEELIAIPAASAQTSVRVDGKDYRGEIHLILNPRGRINVVNALPLEEYLRGVVPLELPPGVYPEIEALKAQAIAARSYALARLGQNRDEGFDLVDDARAQVYGGLGAERELSNRAVEETRGMCAVFPNDEGKLVPIEALYTANCGGRTENNEEVFGGKPVAYLRAVACSPDPRTLSGREIVTDRGLEPLTGSDGRLLAREVAILSVLGFSLPRRVTGHYLRESADRDEIRNWAELAARLTRKEKPEVARADVTRLADFARLVVASIYGEGYASTLLAPADVDYLLDSVRIEQVPRDARADLAILLRDGILRLPADGMLNGRAAISRGQAIEALARALLLKSQTAGSRSSMPDFKVESAAAAERGRLVIAATTTGATTAANPIAQKPRFATVSTTAPVRASRSEKDGPLEKAPTTSAGSLKVSAPPVTAAHSDHTTAPIAEGAWLFRTLGDQSYPVNRLSLVGGERVIYHLDSAGRVDFLEANTPAGGASSDRFSRMAGWQDRVSPDELQQRLARSRINVGRLENIEPVTFSSSNRVTEVEITGAEGRARLRRPQIRSALGLKESLFVVDRETDERGLVVAFVFTGRGWGHGVGMCQTGAYGLARDGYSYAAILKKYYTGVALQKMY